MYTLKNQKLAFVFTLETPTPPSFEIIWRWSSIGHQYRGILSTDIKWHTGMNK